MDAVGTVRVYIPNLGKDGDRVKPRIYYRKRVTELNKEHKQDRKNCIINHITKRA